MAPKVIKAAVKAKATGKAKASGAAKPKPKAEPAARVSTSSGSKLRLPKKTAASAVEVGSAVEGEQRQPLT